MNIPSKIRKKTELHGTFDKKILFGNISREDLLVLEIKNPRRPPDYYTNLAKSLDYAKIKDVIRRSIEEFNVSAFIGLCRANVHAAIEALITEPPANVILRKAAYEFPRQTYALFFLLRRKLPPDIKKRFLDAIKSALVRKIIGISFTMGRREKKRTYDFHEEFHEEFDLDETLERLLEKRMSPLSYSDIVWLKRMEKRNACILMLDTSGSMYGEKNLIAAMAAITVAYRLKNSELGIVAFNTSAMVVKHVNSRENIGVVLDKILELEASGYTNIRDALRKGLAELRKSKAKKRWGLLITDGMYNTGGDPRPLARKFPKLHVIALPAQNPHGLKVCRDLAYLGKGRLAIAKGFSDLGPLLLDILGKV
ncbi:MAG: vWA domain-containing protein [Candidatus Baldrarchaeia archaeon]